MIPRYTGQARVSASIEALTEVPDDDKSEEELLAIVSPSSETNR